MSGNIEHCPFVNRTDPRCAEHLNLSHLDHALEYCFNHFEYCPVYLELLRERQQRGSRGLASSRSRYAIPRLVQVNVPAAYEKRSA